MTNAVVGRIVREGYDGLGAPVRLRAVLVGGSLAWLVLGGDGPVCAGPWRQAYGVHESLVRGL